ncbi:unnamed protein product [Lactuca saligna]|uniref:CTP synthase N-terminal domain-containing protein n=1 Tax=Lactuca saligna TaxID=75948 RepID=A0AA35Z9C9_LACSI|nr:unnamed protein product [Lactuca saligna]
MPAMELDSEAFVEVDPSGRSQLQQRLHQWQYQRVGKSHYAHSILGTPEFMAPELYEEDYTELNLQEGDIEKKPFIEALSQLFFSTEPDNFCLIHVSLVPVLGVVGEQKTKPTHHNVRELRALGLTPHFLACRSAQPLLENTKQKLSQFCHVPATNILNIHETARTTTVKITMVGKYVGVTDSYLSVVKVDEDDYYHWRFKKGNILKFSHDYVATKSQLA